MAADGLCNTAAVFVVCVQEERVFKQTEIICPSGLSSRGAGEMGVVR